MSQTTYLITGANRGLGLGLVQALLLRPRTTVIATVRDPANPDISVSVKNLEGSLRGETTRLIIEKLDATSKADALDLVQRLRTNHSIATLDVVIASAGISKHHGLAHEVSVQEVAEHFETNALGPLLLFQATRPLLDAAAIAAGIPSANVDVDVGVGVDADGNVRERQPKFVAISSIVSSITNVGMFQLPNTPYGSSKAALNFILRKIHYENPNLTVLALHPGWIQSDMGNAAAARAGLAEAPVTIEASVQGILQRIDEATKVADDRFLSFDGTELAW